jgi:hypothetical protein
MKSARADSATTNSITARLLTQVAPLVFVDDTFALKGGTAINLFVRDHAAPVGGP